MRTDRIEVLREALSELASGARFGPHPELVDGDSRAIRALDGMRISDALRAILDDARAALDELLFSVEGDTEGD